MSTQDELIAITALSHMRANSLPALTPSSTAATTPSTDDAFNQTQADVDFVSRVSRMPVVNTAIKAYETAKTGSRVVKYGAEMVESSVKTISRPVMDRLDARLTNVMDDWGCRTLDRVGLSTPGPSSVQLPLSTERHRPYSPSSSSSSNDEIEDYERAFQKPTEQGELSIPSDRANPSFPLLHQPTSRSQQQLVLVPEPTKAVERSGMWSSMLVEAGMTAGGIGAAVSEESMKSLQYCLKWLQYATSHLTHQISILRNLIASLNDPLSSQAVISPAALDTLSRIKADVVDTIRKVVDVVSKYAGGALPEAARGTVRSFILGLPERWERANERLEREEGPRPAERPTRHGVLVGTARGAAGRVMTLAVESLDMITGVAQVFGESLDRAESWIERLRVLGVQRQQARSRESPLTLRPPDSYPEDAYRAHRSPETSGASTPVGLVSAGWAPRARLRDRDGDGLESEEDEERKRSKRMNADP